MFEFLTNLFAADQLAQSVYPVTEPLDPEFGLGFWTKHTLYIKNNAWQNGESGFVTFDCPCPRSISPKS